MGFETPVVYAVTYEYSGSDLCSKSENFVRGRTLQLTRKYSAWVVWPQGVNFKDLTESLHSGGACGLI